MTAASVELLTGAGAALLLRSGINVDVVGTVLHFLSYHCEARAIILRSPKHSSLRPVGPEDVLLEDSHSVRILDPLEDHLAVLTVKSAALNLFSGREERVVKKCEQYVICCNIVYIKKHTLRHQPSRASFLHNPEKDHWVL